MMTKYRCLILAALLFALPSTASAQITVTAPTSATNVKAGDDFATSKFQDPWDMKQNTDLGWHIWSIDAPPTGIGSVAFNQPATANALNGTAYFHGVTTNTASNIEFLQAGNPFSAKLGRTGDLFPIDANTYKTLTFRMCVTGSGTPPRGGFTGAFGQSTGFVVWLNAAGAMGVAGPFITYAGCQIYSLDMTTLTKQNSVQWTGSVPYLRIDPTHVADVTLDLDWATLVAPDAAGVKTITWTGGSADLYLDNNATLSDGTLGMLYKGDGNNAQVSLAKGVSSGYTFDMSVLAPGQYFVMVCPAGAVEGASTCRYTGAFNVNGVPTITITAPSEEGSADDFATVQLNNPWDFDLLTDIDFSQNLASTVIDSAFPAQRPDGADLGNIRVLRGTPSSSNPGDPYFYTLFFAGNGRGVTKKIDANRYRILTIEAGLPGPRDINNGSIARIVWKTTAETNENVSQDIIINHRAGVNVLDTISVDMKYLLRETDAGLGTLGWTGQIENFRFDPHEFTPITQFYVRKIKLAAFETIGSTNTYTIKWTTADLFDSPNTTGLKVSAAYDPVVTSTGLPSGTRVNISSCQAVTASVGQCTWLTNSVATGTYFVYLTVTDGVNTNAAYAKYPVIVDPAAQPKPRMVLDRSVLNFGGNNNNGASVTVTPAQQVRLSIVGSGTVNWTASTQGTESGLFTVSPTSGTGPAVLTVSVPPFTGIPNNLNGKLGTMVVSSSQADNTPQAVTVNLAMTATPANPFGGFDTPAEGAVLQGSIAVTGWVLDDIGVSKVDILRDANPGDPPGAVSGGKVFVGTATLVDGARSDIVALFPNSPANYNAGWGYLMLTRGLIWDGKGPFKLYAQASDIDGHVVTLGSKTVTVDNANAAKPFGAIDTPGQGGTASGTYPNTGWVLTPGAGNVVPGSGVQVAIDGVFLPNVFGTSDRSDITAGFPTFNTTGAGRGAFIDMTLFADGVHTIGWFVTDNLGRADGVGSRFFRVANSSLISTSGDEPGALAGATTSFARLGETAAKLGVPVANIPVSFAAGMTPRPVFKHAAAGLDRPQIRIGEMERVVLNVGTAAEAGASYSAYRVVDGKLHLLPVGAAFDTRKGAFYWLPGPGFVGDYDFVFVKNRKGVDVAQVPVRITVGPSSATLRAAIFRPSVTIASRPE